MGRDICSIHFATGYAAYGGLLLGREKAVNQGKTSKPRFVFGIPTEKWF